MQGVRGRGKRDVDAHDAPDHFPHRPPARRPAAPTRSLPLVAQKFSIKTDGPRTALGETQLQVGENFSQKTKEMRDM